MDESYDQDTTDLHKCISYIKDQNTNLDLKTVSSLQTLNHEESEF